jgi:hypothetical protein
MRTEESWHHSVGRSQPKPPVQNAIPRTSHRSHKNNNMMFDSNANYMPATLLPPPENFRANSTHRLSRLDMQRAITDVKRFIEKGLETDLCLVKVRYTWHLTDNSKYQALSPPLTDAYCHFSEHSTLLRLPFNEALESMMIWTEPSQRAQSHFL